MPSRDFLRKRIPIFQKNCNEHNSLQRRIYHWRNGYFISGQIAPAERSPQKVGSDSEPSRGRLQVRSKGSARPFWEKEKQTNTPSFRWGIVSGACSDVLIIDNIDICIESAAGANREKVVGKRRAKNRARIERMFFAWERGRAFLRKMSSNGAN